MMAFQYSKRTTSNCLLYKAVGKVCNPIEQNKNILEEKTFAPLLNNPTKSHAALFLQSAILFKVTTEALNILLAL